jgi:hypothetical protein
MTLACPQLELMPASTHPNLVMTPRPAIPRIRALLHLALLSLLTASCSTASGGSKQFAAVTLHGHDPLDIRQTTSEVFAEKGYRAVQRSGVWYYDRGTSAMGELLHGGWFNEEGVHERAKLRLIPLSEGSYRLECEAVMVRDAGDSFFEEETRMTRLKSGPYKKLLAEVEKRLSQR